ncbi:hypothetical protein M419DRAFT_124478 [Trichoderma reesei RUT C-30]|uniref:Uncharacterized protein n=1 Tax=Hypocrea jecorina (strain ATCC 56765 / BCRC 32924 / NRRL 11460 / Rut C-30) TaxID=1344414 RepID=A0A024S3J0_HYPJR|nr:hypothetical protein M419DRAFT_124478 [Trichoderma reesei RUT C-30]
MSDELRSIGNSKFLHCGDVNWYLKCGMWFEKQIVIWKSRSRAWYGYREAERSMEIAKRAMSKEQIPECMKRSKRGILQRWASARKTSISGQQRRKRLVEATAW